MKEQIFDYGLQVPEPTTPKVHSVWVMGGYGRETKPDVEQVEICKRFLNAYTCSHPRVNRKYDSYALKHIVERWAKEYVSNGALIEAARQLSYTYRRTARNSPNVFFRIKLLPGYDIKVKDNG